MKKLTNQLDFLKDYIPINSFTMMKKGSEKKVRCFMMGLHEQVRKDLEVLKEMKENEKNK